MDNVVFVCGALRSDSTVLHLMLDTHPTINNLGEFDFLFDYSSSQGDTPDVKSYLEHLSANQIFQAKSLKIDASLAYDELIYSFISQLKQKYSVLALNIHRNFDRIHYLFPNAKFIHLIRAPVMLLNLALRWVGQVMSIMASIVGLKQNSRGKDCALKYTLNIF